MKKLQPEERAQLIEEIVKRNAVGLDPIGTSIRRLRLEVTGLDQATFAAMCKMSTKSLYELESGKSNPKLSTLEAVLRLFGVRMGMVMTVKHKPAPPVFGNNLDPLKVGGPVTRFAQPGANVSPLAHSDSASGPKRGKSPAAAKAKKAMSRPASSRSRKSSQDE
ncbi:helix-turn-helix transcriptional regulator [Pseudomonas entomophila]|jgi:DNA-binding XRE family transcriptional regulator|uniref:helix-turn-helix transcriptional regulator n=1 Tax=Pseudomonas entomophila TaxID=312306 RepID=UPI0015E31032|nr:helix-turn-helix transcriptional regulator [Pseudomonas entomophila]MBA1195106.1 helix-turn-helix transcriptional regulator [Pseudomonas entomophila]